MLKDMIDNLNEGPDDAINENTAEDASHELDLVTFFSSSNNAGEMEATAIHSILEANDIPSVLVGASSIPSLEFQVQVPRSSMDEAKRIVAEAKEAGPAAAAEAELATE